MAGWSPLEELVREEIKQRHEEGCDVEGFQERWERARGEESDLLAIYSDLAELKERPEFPYDEPSDLSGIRGLRPDGPRTLGVDLSDEAMQDRIYGAWLGRSAGCILGKPMEQGPFMAGSKGSPGWKNVYRWFDEAGCWPISDFAPFRSEAEGDIGVTMNEYHRQVTKGGIKHVVSDDDLRYTVLGLILLEKKGLKWDTWDVGTLWHQILSYRQVCTAETQAYLNFAHVVSHTSNVRPTDVESKLCWVNTYLNPYREFIGAQIRVDAYGYAAAGQPQLAAELAWRDAHLSHVKNGVYGAMFIGAMIAAAFVERDIETIVRIGLSEIPSGCRLAEAVNKAVDISKNSTDQLELVSRIWDEFSHYDPVHSINNSALCVAALLFGDGDFEKAIATAVLGGWDTDCNGATVGSIMGAYLGAEKLPQKWVRPFNDTLYSEIVGFHPISISECAKRTYDVYKGTVS